MLVEHTERTSNSFGLFHNTMRVTQVHNTSVHYIMQAYLSLTSKQT